MTSHLSSVAELSHIPLISIKGPLFKIFIEEFEKCIHQN